MKYPLIIIAIALSSLTACDNKPNSSLATDATPRQAEQTFVDVAPTSPTPVAQSANAQAIDCQAVTSTLTAIDINSQIDDFDKADKLLNHCLPTADNTTQIKWATQYQLAYQRFLSFWQGDKFLLDEAEFDQLNQVMYDIHYNKKYNESNIVKLPPKAQHLIKQVKQNKLKIADYCEGEFDFVNDYQAFAKLFTPHLPKGQAVMIERLASDNQEPLWCDAGLSISLDELIERALFWQDYQKTYPQSVFIDDAKRLSLFYEYLLFFDSDNTRWLNDDKTAFITYINENDETFTDEASFVKLAKHNSELGKKAQAFLAFIATPTDERDDKYPINPANLDERHLDDPSQIEDWERATLQLMTALDKTKVDTPSCISTPICLPDTSDEP
ncbi:MULTISPECIES: hypothetical protein [Moraxella]|uniref:Uncharacterized protein n=2 Tax=Moraxella lacunata TaxID=477 RepID=A0A1B8PV77_MORLA|nr:MULTISPECIES: hypothetical protein [Moraxella]MBE9579164.1 hypothetical protein [Moraxella sp. K1664]MBE9588422.1 hypothetical protein [Moraxella sp. K1630]MBE9596582.1 hypothetical protein [Moraxella sp. K2450]MDH9219135.1 hypothetical protein [Moraxella lacunata]MDI4483163.1 hypothetical protein [Moraxella lacunata]